MEPNIPSAEEINLRKYWLILKRQWLPATGVFIAVSTLAALSTLFEQPVFQAQGRLLFKSSRASSLVGLGGEIGRLETLAFGGNPLDTQAQIVKSIPVANTVIDTLNLTTDEGEKWSPQLVVEPLQVSNIPGTDVLRIAYKSPDPEKAAAIVNQVMNAYIAINIEANRTEAKSAREFIEAQLPKTEAAVEKAERALRRFKQDNQIIDLKQEASAIVDILGTLDNQIATVESQLAEVSTQTQALGNQLGGNLASNVDAVTLSQASGVQDVLKELQGVQSDLAIEQTRYRDGHPNVEALKRQEVALSSLLQERIGQVVGTAPTGSLEVGNLQQSLTEDLIQFDLQRLGLEQRLTQLRQTRQNYQSRVEAFPDLERTQGALERRQLTARSTYEALLLRLQEVQVAENQLVENARIIENAVIPEAPVGGRKKLIVAAGVVCGALLAVAVAFLLDLIDRSIKTIQDAQELLEYPLLGLLPEELSDSSSHQYYAKLPVLAEPHSHITQAFQRLRANLQLISSPYPHKLLTITSATTKEKTSVLTANLAAAIAQSNQTVLLIDSHLVYPIQHAIWGIPNDAGFSEVVQQNVPPQDVVQAVNTNLSVLTAGLSPLRSLTMFDSNRLIEHIQKLSYEYDWIIFDAPSLSESGDAVILGQLSNGIALSLDPNKADIGSLKSAKSLLERSEQNVLGIIATGVDEAYEDNAELRMTLWQALNVKNTISS